MQRRYYVVMLETHRLRLAPVETSDTDDIVRLYGDSDVMRYVTGRPLPPETAVESVARGLRHWDDHGYGMFSLFSRDDGSFVGRCGLVHLGVSPEVEVAYILRPESWGQGYASEAALACVELGFKDHGLTQILGLTFLDNVASQRVLLKCGLAFSGTRYHYGRHLLLYARTGPF